MAWWITDGVLTREDYAPAESSIETDITGKGNVVIPEGVRVIFDAAFENCKGMTGVVIPEGVTEIGQAAFCGCEGLKELTLPESVVSVGGMAFCYCENLKKVNVFGGVKDIGESAFSGDAFRKEFILNVSDAAEEVSDAIACWNHCGKLTLINVPENHPVFRWEGEFLMSRSGVLLWALPNIENAVIPDGVTGIGKRAFYVSSLKSVVIPESVTEIGEEAFACCAYLTSIIIPESVTKIERSTFDCCFDLKRIVLPARHFEPLRFVLEGCKAAGCPVSLTEVSPKARPALCIGFALTQEKYSEELRTEYIAYIKKNVGKLVEAAFDYPELLHLMCAEKLIAAKDIDRFSEEAAKRGNVELTAAILDYQANALSAKEIAKARERREKNRERQDETVIDRMAARADKQGIEGLNFAVTGSLRQFDKRDDLKNYIAERGGKLVSVMSAKTDYLITNDTNTGSAKNKKAAELGIEIISESEFLKMAQKK